MIGAAISLSIMLGWWLSPRNWILNDLISICLIVSCMKVFKFVAFKTALLAYVCVTVV